MKILYVHRTQGTGAEGVHIASIINSFKKLGHEVIVVSPPGVDPLQSAGSNPYGKGKTAVGKFLKMLSRSLPQFLFEMLELAYNFRNEKAIEEILSSKKVDFIYERHSFFSYAASKLSQKYQIPHVIEINELAGDQRIRKQCFVSLARRIDHQILNNARGIIVVSSYLKEKIESIGISPEKVIVIPNAVTPEMFKDISCDAALKKTIAGNADTVVIGFIGWFVHWHNLEMLIDVFGGLSEKHNIKLLLIGDGVLKEKLKKQCAGLNIENKVVFPGAVEHSQIPRYIGIMDIAVIPDSNEYRSPIKMFEYMAMAKPVLAPNTEPIESVIKDNSNGKIFLRNDAGSFYKSMEELIKDKSARLLLGEQARKTILENYTWEKNAVKVLDKFLASGY